VAPSVVGAHVASELRVEIKIARVANHHLEIALLPEPSAAEAGSIFTSISIVR